MAVPNINVPGRSIPSGYLIGRSSPGTGPQELLSLADVGRQLVALNIVPAAGAPASSISIANNRVLGNTSGSTAAASAQALTQPAAGLTITGGSNAFTFALANDLAALEGLSSTGIAARTTTDTWAQRTITGTASRISLTNGNGVSGNPTIDIDVAYVGQASITTLGTIATGTWAATTISVDHGGTGQTSYTNGQLLIGNTTGNTLAKGSLTAPAAGLTITGGAGSITFALANDLAALEGMASTGLVARTASETYAQRTITGTANRLTVTNGDGVSGNPTLDLSTSYVGQATITTLGTITTGTWNAGTVGSATNSDGSLPSSTTTAGWKVTSNYDGTAGAFVGDSTVDFWNTVNAPGGYNTGFAFWQKLSSSTVANLAYLYGDSTFAELDLNLSGTTNTMMLYIDATGAQFGSITNIPTTVVSNNVGRAVFPTTGGITINGTTSGGITIKTPAVAGSNTLTLPAGTTDFSATGGANQFVKQSSAGGAFTVGAIGADDLPGLGAIATAQLDKTSNTTLATVTGMSLVLVAGKTYILDGWLSTTAGASGGLKVQLVASGGLTITSGRYGAIAYNGTTTVANTTVTALTTNIVANTAVITDVDISGSIVVNAGGTLTIQAAQNASNGTTTSVFASSYLTATRIN